MTTSLATEILVRGEPAINEIIAERREETLHLEFKTLSSNSGLNRDDRKMIAKAVCGFANAEGGLLIVGIGTTKIDGIDTASNIIPIRGLNRVRNLVIAAVPELLSPQHNSISVHAIMASSGSDEGFILIEIPPSDNRPHMSISEQRYFRRGSDGTRVLVHGEIRELMFATREGALEMRCGIRPGVATGDLRFDIRLILNIRNVGRVPVTAPFVRIEQPGWTVLAELQNFDQRWSSETRYGIYGTRDTIVHLEDEIGLVQFPTGLDFRRTGQHHLASAVQMIKKGDTSDVFRMIPWNEMAPEIRPQQDYPVSVSGSFGAENAPAKAFSLNIGKMDLFKMLCEFHSLR
jgi:hypothetical protein